MTQGLHPVSRNQASSAAPGVSPARMLAVVSLGYLLASWGMNPVSSILPTIADSLQVDVTHVAWLMNGYFVLLVSGVLIAGKMGDAFGHGQVFRMGCLVFAVGSACGVAPAGGYPLLLIGRGIQGLGSALIFGTSLAIVAAAYRGSSLSLAVGIVTVSSGVSSLIGVYMSTWLAQHVDWHLSFLTPTLLGLGLGLFGKGLPSTRRLSAREVDWLGGLLLFGTLILLLLGINHLHEGPETFEAGAPYHLSMHIAALGCFAAFLWRQSTARRPLINLALFKNARLTTGVAGNGIAHSSMLATGLLIPFLIERGRGFSPTETAALVFCMQIALIAASFVGGLLYARLGSSPFLGVGSLASISVGLLVLGRWGAEFAFPSFFPMMALLGGGLGLFSTVNNSAVMSSVSAEQRGFASGMVELTRQLGHSLGVSISGGILADALLRFSQSPQLGYREGFSEAAFAMGLMSISGVGLVLYSALRGRPSMARATTSLAG